MRSARPLALLCALVLIGYGSARAQDSTLVDETFDTAYVPALPNLWRSNPIGQQWMTTTSLPSPGSGGNNAILSGVTGSFLDSKKFWLTGLGSAHLQYYARRTAAYPVANMVVTLSHDNGISFPDTLIFPGAALPENGDEYELISVNIPARLFRSGVCMLRFNAKGASSGSANIRIDDVKLTARKAALLVSADTLSFATDVGKTVAQTLSVINASTSTVTVQVPLLSNAAFKITPTVAVTLAPGEETLYNVVFAPETSDLFSGTLSFDSPFGVKKVTLIGRVGSNEFAFAGTGARTTDGGEPLIVPLKLNYLNQAGLHGFQFDISWNPAAFTFAGVDRGRAIASEALWNLSSHPIAGGVRVLVLSTTTSGLPQARYDTLVSMRFSAVPLVGTDSASTTLLLSNVIGSLALPTGDDAALSAGEEPFSVTVLKNRAAFQVDASPMLFGAVAVGSAISFQKVVSNPHGTGNLQISAVNSTNTLFAVSPATASVPPNSDATFTFTFTPLPFDFGRQEGEMIFIHNAGSPVIIPVNGHGTGGRGDADGDGRVDALDLVGLINLVLGRTDPSPALQPASDLYPFPVGDAKFDVHDLTVLAQAISRGKWPNEHLLPVEQMEGVGGMNAVAEEAPVSLFVDEGNFERVLYLDLKVPLRAFQMVAELQGADGADAGFIPGTQIMMAPATRQEGLRVLLYRADGEVIPAGRHALAYLPKLEDNAVRPSYAVAVDGDGKRLVLDLATLVKGGTDGGVELPERALLGRPFPNPVQLGASNLRIPLEMNEQGAVRVSVYDLLGRKVAVLADERIEAGRRMLSWDGTGIDGMAVAPGMYMVQAVFDGGMQSAAVVVLR